ncbi:AKR_collapsed_G0047210.mRNA.1.CDS.1 [Saccharomyces cerevisiae]|nr:AKR_collapsed_G0047210.mRNA.1.CDS.1 [Saccharomyces cerevisiae]
MEYISVLGKLLPGLKNNFATIADPEAREVTLKALKTLRRVGNVGEDDVLPEISHAGDVSTTLGVIKDHYSP